MPVELTTWLLVFLRVGALLAVLPVFSGRGHPVALRVALGALLSGFVSVTLPPAANAGDSAGALVGLMAVEVCVGLLLGFVSRMIFFAVEFVGAVISAEIGLNLPPGMNPLNESQSTLPAIILQYLAMALWLTLDLHHWMLRACERSYDLLPIGGAGVSEDLAVELLRHTSEVFFIGLQMAAPIMAVMFLISLIFSVLARAVPQMNVFVENFAVRAMAGLAVFGLTCQLMAQHMINSLRRLPEDLLGIARLLGGT
jgi:flagellar biosynthetic protein FliR